MPYFSVQDLLSALPYSVPGELADSVVKPVNNRERLRQYRSLSLLFADESDQRFDIDNFGFLTPKEALLKYENNYNDRFKAYFGSVLGAFLQEVPLEYQQQ